MIKKDKSKEKYISDIKNENNTIINDNNIVSCNKDNFIIDENINIMDNNDINNNKKEL